MVSIDTELCPDCLVITNPFYDEPREYFYLHIHRYYPFDRDAESVACRTIDVLNLNDLNDKCAPRFQIVTAAIDKLSQELRHASELGDTLQHDLRKRNRARNALRDILRLCVPSADFSAFVATAVRSEEAYSEYKSLLQRIGAWDDELESLERQSDACVFAERPRSDIVPNCRDATSLLGASVRGEMRVH